MGLSTAQLVARQALLKRGIWAMIEQGETLESLLIRLVENIEGQSTQMLAAVFLYNPTKNDLTIGAAPNLQPVYKKAVNGFRVGPDQPACGSAVFKRQQVIATDVKNDPLWESLRSFAEAIGVRAVWSQPIFADDNTVLGTVAFYHPEPKTPDRTDHVILETSASIAATIIQARSDQAKILINSEEPGKNFRHQCMIYDGAPSDQLEMLSSLFRQKLEEGFRCLYLNSPTMVTGLRSCLSAMGVDVVKEVAEQRLILSSESTTTASGSFDSDEMLRRLEEAVNHALQDGFKGLWASGDMTWEFGADKDFTKLLEYEHGLEALFKRNANLQGICQYHRSSLPPEAIRHGLVSHRYVFINQTLSYINPHHLSSGQVRDLKESDKELDIATDALSQLCEHKQK